MNARFLAQHREFTNNHGSLCDCATYQVSTDNVMDAICRMKIGKCAEEDGLAPEHFHHAPFCLIQKHVHLFNCMLRPGTHTSLVSSDLAS